MNMDSILYIFRKTVKNAVIDAFRHPLMLVMYGIFFLSIISAVLMGYSNSTATYTVEKDTRALYGGYLALLHFISIPIMLKGLSSGTSFFSMSDVNNIFVAPMSEKKILIYGVGRQLASMLFLAVCFSAYGGMAMNIFRLSFEDAVWLILGIIVMFVLVQMITLMIFCLSSGHPKRAKVMKYMIYAIPVYALAVVGIYMFTNGMTVENLLYAVSQPILEYSPIGWLHGVIFGIIDRNYINIAVYGISLLVSMIACILVFIYAKLDYYEDVLGQAESNYAFRESLRTGNMGESFGISSQKLKSSKIGIKKGSGANAIFYKHLKEGERRSRFIFLNISTAVLIGVALVTGLVINQIMDGIYRTTVVYLGTTVICAYLQFFFSAAGDWVKELSKPYIFLIPDDPVKKLIMASATSIIKPFTDGTIAYLILALIVGGQIPDIITSILVYGSFGCVYIAANVLAQRIVGMNGNRGVFITFYMSLIFLLMIPGIVLGILSLSHAGELSIIAAAMMGIPVFLWNMLISFLIFLLCRNLLNNVE